MKLRNIVAVLAAISGGPALAQLNETPFNHDCPVDTNDASSHDYGNDALRTMLWDRPVVFRPGGPGFVDYDGALGMKWPFERLIEGRLGVGGRRLDAEAPPARAYLNDGYGLDGFQPVYLVFPTPGCWEITAGVAGRKMSFIVLVEKIDDGPDWAFDGVPEDWHVTTRWNDYAARSELSSPADLR